jgi:hypothetical protein
MGGLWKFSCVTYLCANQGFFFSIWWGWWTGHKRNQPNLATCMWRIEVYYIPKSADYWLNFGKMNWEREERVSWTAYHWSLLTWNNENTSKYAQIHINVSTQPLFLQAKSSQKVKYKFQSRSDFRSFQLPKVRKEKK